MPNPTFFNLPEPKRCRLMEAVWQEFTAVSYMDASINRIIQSAGISRGSFYQYFAGKKDVFTYMLCTILEGARDQFTAQLTVHGNNLFSAVLGMYDLILWKNSRGRKNPGIERIHTLIRLNAEMDMTQFADKLDCTGMTRKFSELLRRSGYLLEDATDCRAVIHMICAVSMSNLTDSMRRPTNETRNRQLLERQLDFIRRSLTPIQEEGTAPC